MLIYAGLATGVYLLFDSPREHELPDVERFVKRTHHQ